MHGNVNAFLHKIGKVCSHLLYVAEYWVEKLSGVIIFPRKVITRNFPEMANPSPFPTKLVRRFISHLALLFIPIKIPIVSYTAL